MSSEDAKATRTGSGPAPRFGQFDKSFVLRVIRNYAISAVLLLLLLVGMTYLLFRYQFATEGPELSQQTAERLAGDVRSIMVNEGGPVASRTVYPILQRNYERLGYNIAIIPSEVTVTSISDRFGFKPQGVRPDWPQEGRFQEASVELPAQEFCIQCHVDAEPGQSLGKVVVRNYFSSYFEQWRHDATLSAVAGTGNILVSIVILFCVMRSLMEPVLRLRAMVSRWAKGTMPLDERIEVKTEDEFGELAHDLNLTLDRIFDILQDLRASISRQRSVHSDVTDEVSRITETAEQLRRTLAEGRNADMDVAARAMDDLEARIERVQMLRDRLHETLRSQELLVKRLE